MGIMALPANASRGWNNLSSLVDDIWHHSGDKSVDVRILKSCYIVRPCAPLVTV